MTFKPGEFVTDTSDSGRYYRAVHSVVGERTKDMLTFCDWLEQKLGTSKWVVAKRATAKLRFEYGVILKPLEFTRLKNEYEYYRLFAASAA